MQAIRTYNSNHKTLSVYEKALEFVKDFCGGLDGFHDDLMREKILESVYSITKNIAESRATMYCGKELSCKKRLIKTVKILMYLNGE